jgi:hypothetical protein
MILTAVYEGVLRKISPGQVISCERRGAYYVQRFGVIRKRGGVRDDQAGWTQHQFVDIGETRIRNVVLMPYQEALLQEAVGEEVALSMTGPEPSSGKRHTVVAIRTPKGGVDRPSEKQLWVGAVLYTLRTWLGAVILTVLLSVVLFLVAGVIAKIFDASWPVFAAGLVIAGVVVLAVFVTLIVAPIVDATRAFRAAGALDRASPAGVPSTT